MLLMICMSLFWLPRASAAGLMGRPGGLRALVVLPESTPRIKFSKYLDNLMEHGFDLEEVHGALDSATMELLLEHQFDSIAIFTGGLSAEQYAAISTHLETGGNLLIAADSSLSPHTRKFLRSVGVGVEPNVSNLVDYESSLQLSDGGLDAIYVAGTPSSPILRQRSCSAAPVLYRGIGLHTIDSSVLVSSVLTGNPLSTFSASTLLKATATGSSLIVTPNLCTMIQARNNARVVVTGSVDMFTNNFFSKFITGNTRVDNEAFCHDISLWAFAQTGVLRYHHNYHIKQDGSLPETILSDKSQTWELAESMHTKPEASRNDLVYRVKDDVQYSVIIEEFHGYGAGGELIWKPFIADDIQLEFVMLDPYVRQTMSLCNNDSELCDSLGLYTAKLKVPDVHGVFKFRILYRRLGYSVLHVEDQVVVRPFSHNEFERFIPSAYPYYFSVFITLAGFLSLIFVLQFT